MYQPFLLKFRYKVRCIYPLDLESGYVAADIIQIAQRASRLTVWNNIQQPDLTWLYGMLWLTLEGCFPGDEKGTPHLIY